jgi:methionine-rich copper-binding protein CopC
VSRRIRSLFLTLAVFVVSVTGPVKAFAHAILESSQPGDGATITAGDVSFRLTYNSRIDPDRSVLTLTLPDQSKTRLVIASGAAPNILASAQHLAAGSYVLHWQVLSVDGHITRGQISFTVQGQ